MLKETEKTLGFVVVILSLVAFQLGEEWAFCSPPPTPFGYAYDEVVGS